MSFFGLIQHDTLSWHSFGLHSGRRSQVFSSSSFFRFLAALHVAFFYEDVLKAVVGWWEKSLSYYSTEAKVVVCSVRWGCKALQMRCFRNLDSFTAEAVQGNDLCTSHQIFSSIRSVKIAPTIQTVKALLTLNLGLEVTMDCFNYPLGVLFDQSLSIRGLLVRSKSMIRGFAVSQLMDAPFPAISRERKQPCAPSPCYVTNVSTDGSSIIHPLPPFCQPG